MNSRDLTLITISATIGAVTSSFFAIRFFSNHKKPIFSSPPSSIKSAQVQSPFDPSKRKQYLSWDDYFMAIAFLSAERSKDPNRQVGACLVSENGIILVLLLILVGTYSYVEVHFMCKPIPKSPSLFSGIGYNGFPRGCSDDKLPWAKKSVSGDPLETKYPYVVHAEVNAILNTNHASAAGLRLYVTMFPCNECAKIIIQSGVSEVIYFIEKRLGSSDTAYVASHKLLTMAGIKVRRHQPQMSQISVHFKEP